MMTGQSPDSLSDVWSDWLLHYRHAGDPEFNRAVRARLELYADRVLDGARLAPNMILADIGAGDGLIAFRAIERIGHSLHVLLTDVSAPMLQHAERLAIQRDIKHQCTFLQCPAENLKVIADASVDVVTARAVLAYVADKHAAIREFYRVLKPGGRISIAEPIFRDDALSATALKNIVDAHPLEPRVLFTHLLHRWKAAQFPDTVEKISESPIANYSERDLVRFAHASGFVNIHMELHIDVLPSAGTSWKVFIESSPHPWAPPLSVILAEQFTSEEREFFEKTFRPQVESPQFCMIDRIVYLNAMKPL